MLEVPPRLHKEEMQSAISPHHCHCQKWWYQKLRSGSNGSLVSLLCHKHNPWQLSQSMIKQQWLLSTGCFEYDGGVEQLFYFTNLNVIFHHECNIVPILCHVMLMGSLNLCLPWPPHSASKSIMPSCRSTMVSPYHDDYCNFVYNHCMLFVVCFATTVSGKL